MTAPPAERVGRYQLLDPIGVGPSGEVSRAKVFGVAGFERQFAVKRFHAEVTESQTQAQALSAAARAYGSLEHPRIARMSEFGVAKGTTFTAVEHVAGLDALKLVTEARLAGTTLATGGALALVSQAARAIGFAHGRGLTHLGLAPTNVIVTAEGDLKITDFGICAATLPAGPFQTDVGRLANRVAYLSPEQLLGEAPSAATDVFALGVLAYELVTGGRAFKGNSPKETLAAVLAGPPDEPQLPRPIARVILRCMARSPFERFPDARAFADALDAAIRLAPVPGTRKDIGAQVSETLDRLAALRDGEQSGMLAFNVGTGPTPKLSPLEVGRGLGNAPVAPQVLLDPPADAGATQPQLLSPMRTVPGLAPPPIPVPPLAAIPPPPGAALSGLSAPPPVVSRTGTDPLVSRTGTQPTVPRTITPIAPRTTTGSSKFLSGPPNTIVGQPVVKPPGPRTAPMVAQLPPIPARPGTDLEVPVEKAFDPTDQLARTLKDTDIDHDALDQEVARATAPQRPTPPPTLIQPKRRSAPAIPTPPAPGPDSTTLGIGMSPKEPRELLTDEMSPILREKLGEASVVPTGEIEPLVADAHREDAMNEFPDEAHVAQHGLVDPNAPLEPPPNTLVGVKPSRAATSGEPFEATQAKRAVSSTDAPAFADATPKRNTVAWVVGILLGAGALAGGAWFAYTRLKPNPTVATNGTAIVFRDAAVAHPTTNDATQVAVVTPADAGHGELEHPADAAGSAVVIDAAGSAAVAIADAAIVPDAAPIAVVPPDAAAQVAVVTPGSDLAITSTPPGAHVYLDGADVGVTPFKQPGSSAKHSLAVAYVGYDLVLQQIAGSGTIDIPLAKIPPWPGDAGIKVERCAPYRYFVSVDGKPTGMLCPTERINTDVGPHKVDVYDLVAQTHTNYDLVVKDTRLSARIKIDPK